MHNAPPATPSLAPRIPPSIALGFLIGANLWPLLAHPHWAPAWLTVFVAIVTVAAAYRLGSARHA